MESGAVPAPHAAVDRADLAVRDAKSSPVFTVTTATRMAQVEARTFRLSAPLHLDSLISDQASAFPRRHRRPGMRDASLERLTIDGDP